MTFGTLHLALFTAFVVRAELLSEGCFEHAVHSDLCDRSVSVAVTLNSRVAHREFESHAPAVLKDDTRNSGHDEHYENQSTEVFGGILCAKDEATKLNQEGPQRHTIVQDFRTFLLSSSHVLPTIFTAPLHLNVIASSTSTDNRATIVPEATAKPSTVSAVLTTGNIVLAPGVTPTVRQFVTSTVTLETPPTNAGVLSLTSTSDSNGKSEELSKSTFRSAAIAAGVVVLLGHSSGWILYHMYGPTLRGAWY